MLVEVAPAPVTRMTVSPAALRRAEQLMRERRAAAPFPPIVIDEVNAPATINRDAVSRADISRVREYMNTHRRPKHTKPALAALAALHTKRPTT